MPLDVMILLDLVDGSTLLSAMPKIPNPMISHLFTTGGKGGGIGEFLSLSTNMELEATKVRTSHKVYRSSSSSSSSARAFTSCQPTIGLHKQEKKKKKKVSHGVSSFEWVMIRRNLNLSLRRFGADNKGIIITTTNQIPQLLFRDPKQQQQQQQQLHRLGCVVEESSSGMGDEEVKLKKQEDGSIEEKKIKNEEELEEKDLGLPLKPTPPPSPPEKPLPGDCCGNGCIPCVWDTYYEELEDYNNLLKAYNSQSKP